MSFLSAKAIWRGPESEDAIKEHCLTILRNFFDDKDLLLLIQATSPLTQTKDFDKALEKLKIEKSDSLLTCVRTKRFFWTDVAAPLNYDFNNRPRRQDFDGTFMENGAFYINSIGNIKKYQNRLSGKIAIYEMDEYTSIEIDEQDDWIAPAPERP